MLERRRLAIIGAGPAGLATARTLQGRGWDVHVFDARPTLESRDSGCYVLWYAGVMALQRMGLMDRAREVSSPITSFEMSGARGEQFTTIDTVAEGRQFDDSVPIAIKRADLVNVIADSSPEMTFHRGTNVREVLDAAGGPRVVLTDGTEDRFDAVVGADGINSAVRATLHHADPPRHPGYAHFWGMAQAPVTGAMPGTFRIMHGAAVRFAHFWLDDETIVWWCVRPSGPSPEGDSLGSQLSMASLLAEWDPVAAELVSRTEVITRRDTMDQPPLRRWGSARITLAGDAAHAMTFDLGQGAGTALSDGVVLGSLLAQDRGITEALRAYESARRPTANMIARASRGVGASAHRPGIGPALNAQFLKRFGPAVTPRIFAADAKAQLKALGPVQPRSAAHQEH